MAESKQSFEQRMMKATIKAMSDTRFINIVLTNRDLWVLTATCSLAITLAPTGEKVITEMTTSRDLLVDALSELDENIRPVILRQAEGVLLEGDTNLMGKFLSQLIAFEIDTTINQCFWLINCIALALRDPRVQAEQAFHMIEVGREIQREMSTIVDDDVIELLNMGWDEFFDIDSDSNTPINEWRGIKHD